VGPPELRSPDVVREPVSVFEFSVFVAAAPRSSEACCGRGRGSGSFDSSQPPDDAQEPMMIDYFFHALACKASQRAGHLPGSPPGPTVADRGFPDIEGQVKAARHELEVRRQRRCGTGIPSSSSGNAAAAPTTGEHPSEIGILSQPNYQVLSAIVDMQHDLASCSARHRQSPPGDRRCNQYQFLGEI
jgi:hypothetical protein